MLWQNKISLHYLYRGQPQCMASFPNLFGTTRIPKEHCDELVFNRDSLHVVVFYKQCAFSITPLTSDGTVLDVANIETLLGECMSFRPNGSKANVCPAVMTGEDRDSWARARVELLSSSAVNTESLSVIESSLFTVSS